MKFENSNIRSVTEYCDCEVECDCEVSYYFTVNGSMGFGSLQLTGDSTNTREQWTGTFFGKKIKNDTLNGARKDIEYHINTMRKGVVTDVKLDGVKSLMESYYNVSETCLKQNDMHGADVYRHKALALEAVILLIEKENK